MTTQTAAPAAAAADLAPRIRSLIDLTDKLTALIAAQCQKFEAHRPHEAAPIIQEMAPLANLYRHESAKIREMPRLIDQLPAEIVRDLKRATEAFDSVLARQFRAVEAAKEITEGLVKAIAEEVASQRGAKAAGYGPAAAARNGANITAITLNRRA